jgi:hypothetical protein
MPTPQTASPQPRFLKLVSVVATGIPPLAAALVADTQRDRSPTPHPNTRSGWAHLQVGDSVDLVREIDNPFDGRAVRIDWQHRRLGYIPVSENREIAQILDRKQAIRGRIAALRTVHQPWQGAKLEVLLTVAAA